MQFFSPASFGMHKFTLAHLKGSLPKYAPLMGPEFLIFTWSDEINVGPMAAESGWIECPQILVTNFAHSL